jgi:adenine/guanine phosphoribosyltransferase-like PRPP-binding protein
VGAAVNLFRDYGAGVAGVAAVVGLPFLKYEQALPEVPVYTLISYQGE